MNQRNRFSHEKLNTEISVIGIFVFSFLLLLSSKKCNATNCQNTSLNNETSIFSCSYDNGFQIIVASNKAFRDSGVSLMTKSGYFDDPSNMPGLAHLIEHTFHHTVESKGFLEKLYSNNGRYFARTTGFFTQYDFSMPHDQLNWILKNITSFLLNTKFEASYLSQELKIIEEEQKESNNNNSYETLNILRNIFNKNHPLSKVMPTNGHNLSLKGGSLLGDILPYFKNQYRPENLILLVATNQNADFVIKDIEKIMKPFLSFVGNEKLHPIVRPKIFSTDAPTSIFIPKNNNDDSLTYLYPIYDDYSMELHRTVDLIKFFFQLQGDGCLKNQLVKKGLIAELEIDIQPVDTNQLIMSINFSLTEKGKKNIALIEKEYEKYLKFLLTQKRKYPSFIYACFQNQDNYLLGNDASSFLDKLSYPLQINPMNQKDYIYYLKSTYDKDLYENVYNAVHRIFQIKPYKVIYSDQNFLDKLQTNTTIYSIKENAQEQPKNLYRLPEIYVEENKAKINSGLDKDNWKSPQLILSSPNSNVWYKKTGLNQNYSNISFKLNCLEGFTHKQLIFLNKILAKDLSDRLSNLKDSLYFTNSDICVKALENGGLSITSIVPTSFQNQFINEIEKIFKNAKLTNDQFINLYNLIKFDLDVEKSTLSHEDMKGFIQKVLRNSFSFEDSSTKDKLISYDQTVKYYNQICNSFITFLIHGDYSEESAKNISRIISNAIQNREFNSANNGNNCQFPLWKTISEGTTQIKVPMNGQNGKLLVLNIQGIDHSPKSLAQLYLLRSYLEHQFFDYFRSLEAPYYYAEVHSFDQGLQLALFSDDKDENVLINDLNSFISEAKKHINYFDFRKIKKQYLASTWFEMLSFKDLTNEYWRDIIYPEYGINHRRKVKLAAGSVSYADFKNFYNDFLINESNKRVLAITNTKESL